MFHCFSMLGAVSWGMLHLRGLAILVSFQLLGWYLHREGVPLPGAVLGLILFTVGLFTGLIKLQFVPVLIALTGLLPVVARQWAPIGASLMVSLVAVMLTTGVAARWWA